MMSEETKKKRDYLRKLSSDVAPFVDEGEYETVNEAIIETFYRNEIHKEFKTFEDWKKGGFSICRGEKAFLIWGRPKDKQKQEEQKAKGQEPEEPDEDKFFPLCFLFSNAQVERSKQGKNARR